MNVALILNYKEPDATIRCASSILENCKKIDHIIIIDNNSCDNSCKTLSQYAEAVTTKRVYFLANPKNTGYAGGNNFGIKWAIENLPKVKSFWIVNNDTLVNSDAHSPLLAECAINPWSFYGSIILNASTERIECTGGGKIYALLGKTKLINKGRYIHELPLPIPKPDYLMGCSLLVSRQIVDRIGLMDESYFMYSEEIDWQYRAKSAGIDIKLIPQSIISHAGSLSAGSRSEFYYYYRNRAAIMFNKKFYGLPFCITSAILLSLITILQEFKSPKKYMAGIKGAFAGVSKGCDQ